MTRPRLVLALAVVSLVAAWAVRYGGERKPAAPPPERQVDARAAVPIAADRLRQARVAMGEARDGECGPYPLVSDVELRELRSLCEEVVPAVEPAYVERWGVRPYGPPAETILVFAEPREFALFASVASRRRVEANGRASATEGYVAVAWEEQERQARTATLVHEIVHLLNRRALGVDLPAWLDEGLADDLAERLVGGKVQPAAWRVGMDRASGRLPPLADLFRLDADDFYDGRGFAGYAQALLAVRFLADHPRLGGGFRDHLRGFAGSRRGAVADPARALAVEAERWEEAWRAWVDSEFVDPRLPAGSDLPGG